MHRPYVLAKNPARMRLVFPGPDNGAADKVVVERDIHFEIRQLNQFPFTSGRVQKMAIHEFLSMKKGRDQLRQVFSDARILRKPFLLVRRAVEQQTETMEQIRRRHRRR